MVKVESRPTSLATLNVPPIASQQSSADGEAKSSALHPTRRAAVHLHKGLEHPLVLVVRNPDARVGHMDAHAFLIRRRSDGDVAARLRAANGVGHEIDQHLRESLDLARRDEIGDVWINVIVQATLGNKRFYRCQRVLQGHGLRYHRDMSALDPREVQNVIDDMEQVGLVCLNAADTDDTRLRRALLREPQLGVALLEGNCQRIRFLNACLQLPAGSNDCNGRVARRPTERAPTTPMASSIAPMPSMRRRNIVEG